MKEAIYNLTTYEVECHVLYTQVEQAWNKWVEDEELPTASQKVDEVHHKLDQLRATLRTLPIKEKMAQM